MDLAENLLCRHCKVRYLSVCGALEPAESERLESIVSHIDLAANGVLFEQGDRAAHAFNVVDGCMRLYKLLSDGRREITGFLFPGDFLGLASRDAYTYGAEAVTQTKLCRFRIKEFQALLDEFPVVRSRLLEIANDELAAAQEQMVVLGRKSALERVASFIRVMREKYALRQFSVEPMDLPMSRSDIADYLGLTIETVSRTLGELTRAGVIELPSARTLRVVAPDKLGDLAETAI